MIKISNELLSVVFEEEVTNVAYSSIEKYKIDWNQMCYKSAGYYANDIIHITIKDSIYDISIYHLVSILKEWALSVGYNILSGYDDSNTPEAIINHTYSEGGCYCDVSFKAVTEIDVIITSCEWILKKVKSETVNKSNK